jgi:hypothetical protein
MARTTETEGTVDLPVLGKEGDTCEQCGSALAVDQRYCLNCGWRRGESRVDYEQRLMGNGAVSGNGAASGAAMAAPSPATQQWTPAFAILTIALLGVMLLLGVLIGKKGNDNTQTVAAQAAPTTTATAATPTTDTTATTAAAKPAKGGGGGGAGTAPGEGNVVAGGTGDTSGIATADTGKSVSENAKNGPDVVATGGDKAALDPNGQAGGGSPSTCIGC